MRASWAFCNAIVTSLTHDVCSRLPNTSEHKGETKQGKERHYNSITLLNFNPLFTRFPKRKPPTRKRQPLKLLLFQYKVASHLTLSKTVICPAPSILLRFLSASWSDSDLGYLSSQGRIPTMTRRICIKGQIP